MPRCVMDYGVAGVARTFSHSDLGRGGSNLHQFVRYSALLDEMSGIPLAFVR